MDILSDVGITFSEKPKMRAVKTEDTIFNGQYMFTGSEIKFVWLKAIEVNGEDVVCFIENSATLSGPLYILQLSQTGIDIPTHTDKDKELINI